MTTEPTPDEYDYDSLLDAIKELTEQAVKDGADPQFVAAGVLTESMGTALRNGLTCTLKHILHTQDQAERDMRRFYDTYNHRFDLREVLKGNLVEKK